MLAFLLLIALLALVFGVGAVLEAALWVLLVIAVVIAVAVLLIVSAVRRRLS